MQGVVFTTLTINSACKGSDEFAIFIVFVVEHWRKKNKKNNARNWENGL